MLGFDAGDLSAYRRINLWLATSDDCLSKIIDQWLMKILIRWQLSTRSPAGVLMATVPSFRTPPGLSLRCRKWQPYPDSAGQRG
jgi:hypothetical protein